ncbi:MAG TPA: nitroreductase family protein, partial [Herpetosiphonaceae bacterium]
KAAAESRRSVRKYKPDPISTEELTELIRLTSLAPSSRNIQPWRFLVVRNPELKAKLQEVSYNQSQITSAPAVIVLYSDMQDVLANIEAVLPPGLDAESFERYKTDMLNGHKRFSPEELEHFGATQANIALGYLMLIARGLGYDTVPMLGFDAAKVKELLGLPAHVQIPALVPVGYAAEAGHPHHRHAVDTIVQFRD